MRKPFSMEELVVRINNLLQLMSGIAVPKINQNEEIDLGNYLYKPDRYELIGPSQTIKLSQRELEILNVLVAYRNKVTDRKDLLLAVWGDDSFFNSRNLDVYIRKLRTYFEEDPRIQIQTLKVICFLQGLREYWLRTKF